MRRRPGEEQSEAQQPGAYIKAPGEGHGRHTSEKELPRRNTHGECERAENDFDPGASLTSRTMHGDTIPTRISNVANRPFVKRNVGSGRMPVAGVASALGGDRATRRS